MMKIIFTLLLLLYYYSVIGQKFEEIFADELILNTKYAIPDNPAYKVLGLDGHEMLRPTPSILPFAAILSGITGRSGFGVEVAPFFRRSKLGYNPNIPTPFLSSRISLSYMNSNNSNGNAGVGYRVTYSKRRLSPLYGPVDDLSVINDSLMLEFAQMRGKPLYMINEDPLMKKEMLDYVTLKSERFINKSRYLRNTSAWNRTIVDLGVATRFESIGDSITRRVKAAVVSIYGSFGIPLGMRSQLFWGVTSNNDLSNSKTSNYSFNIRIYQGTNVLKGFADIQYKWQHNLASQLYSLGGEMNIYNGIWLDSYIGLLKVRNGFHSTSFSTRINLRLTIPQL